MDAPVTGTRPPLHASSRGRSVLRRFVGRLWREAWSLILSDLSSLEIGWLLRPNNHPELLSTRRVVMIVSRVRLLCGLFAIITPLWFGLDYLTLPREVLPGLFWVRMAATLGFVLIILSLRSMRTRWDAYRALFFLMGVPSGFFVFSYFHMSAFDLMNMEDSFSLTYAYMPFMMVAGLSLFPLALQESVIFVAPMFLCQFIATSYDLPVLNWPSPPASMWLLIMVSGMAVLAGLSQLAFVIALMRETVRDRMTGCFTRRSAEELLEIQFGIAARSGQPLALAFIDLDHFKQVNDTYGHDAGDQVLGSAAESLRRTLRRGDTLARWGGEEFLLIMPGTSAGQATVALHRIHAAGLGARPDGAPLTASIGVAERLHDNSMSWRQLVETADERMYQAKQTGRDRVVAFA